MRHGLPLSVEVESAFFWRDAAACDAEGEGCTEEVEGCVHSHDGLSKSPVDVLSEIFSEGRQRVIGV